MDRMSGLCRQQRRSSAHGQCAMYMAWALEGMVQEHLRKATQRRQFMHQRKFPRAGNWGVDKAKQRIVGITQLHLAAGAPGEPFVQTGVPFTSNSSAVNRDCAVGTPGRHHVCLEGSVVWLETAQ